MEDSFGIIEDQNQKYLVVLGIVALAMAVVWPVVYLAVDGSGAHKHAEALLMGREYPEVGVVSEVSVSPFHIMGISSRSGRIDRPASAHFVVVAKGSSGKLRFRVRLERRAGEEAWRLVHSDPRIVLEEEAASGRLLPH